jgi:hypothetical protein
VNLGAIGVDVVDIVDEETLGILDNGNPLHIALATTVT